MGQDVRIVTMAAAAFLVLGLLLFVGTSAILAAGERRIEAARAVFGLERIVERAERLVGLGLSADTLRRMDVTLRDVVATNERTLAAEIFDATGRSLAASDLGIRGAVVPPSWLSAARTVPAGTVWTTTYRGLEVMGKAIRIGGEAAAADAVLLIAPGRDPVADLPLPLALLEATRARAAVAVPVCLAGGIGIGFLVAGALRRRAGALLAAASACGRPPGPRLADPGLVRAFETAAAARKAATGALEATRARLDALDRET